MKIARSSFLAIGGATIVAAMLPPANRSRKELVQGTSFVVYPSTPQTIAAGSRTEPLHCDLVEFDTTGCFIPWVSGHYNTGCFLAPVACVVQFHANILFQSPKDGAEASVWFMKNVLPPPDGTVGGEIAGDDVSVSQPANYPNVAYNISAMVTRLLKLAPGDRVWAVPGLNGGGPLTGSVGSRHATVNYFQGTVVQVL